MACGACKQFGGANKHVGGAKQVGGANAAPLSYVDPTYKEPSVPAGSNVLASVPGLARPVINATGGSRKRKTRGGFYPSVMGGFVNNASRLIPAAGVTAYRMYKKGGKATRKVRGTRKANTRRRK